MKLAYFVHDLNDPAVHRRLHMLREGGVAAAVLGFARGPSPQRVAGDVHPVCLGQTYDARMVHRTLAVLRAAQMTSGWRDTIIGVDVIMARQLETLALAAMVRRRFAPSARLVFECLDIHRLMTSRGMTGHALRLLEGRLLRACDFLMVSSPAFVEAYFAPAHGCLPPVHLVENKVLFSELSAPAFPDPGDTTTRPGGPPWRIGWFGVIRCRRSLESLAALVRRFPGHVEVVIRGRPARDVLPDFDAVIAATPGLTYHGPYDRRTDLVRIYADIHYVWTSDFYEADANSAWLLPNRLYEGGACGVVPIALRTVETGRWLTRHAAGVCLDEPLDESLVDFIGSVDALRHATAQAAMRRIPQEAFICDAAACRDLAAMLAYGRTG